MTTLICILLSAFYTTTPFQNLGCKDIEIADKVIPHQRLNEINTVVLDAGHGGKDDGCSGSHSKEKHLALNITLALGRAIEANYPEVNVIYTRTDDTFIPLYERANIANSNNADLFISIHCNALGKKLAYIKGTETFVMGIDHSEHNTEVARRENESILLEEDYEKNYEGFDPNSNEGHIFLSMFQNAFLDRSILLAEKVEKYAQVVAKRKSRGVRQAGFVVLRETTMPSVLIETGFLTNSTDEAFLRTEAGQEQIAYAIFQAFKDYKTEVEQEITIFNTTSSTPAATVYVPVQDSEALPSIEEKLINTPPSKILVSNQSVTPEAVLPIRKEIIISKANERATEPIEEILLPSSPSINQELEEAVTTVETAVVIESEASSSTSMAMPIETQEILTTPRSTLIIEEAVGPTPTAKAAVTEEAVLLSTIPVVRESTTMDAEETLVVEAPEEVLVEKSPAAPITFRVQVAASLTPLETTSPRWQIVKDLVVQQEKNLYKYQSGNHGSYEAAVVERQELTKQGFKGAFVVAYKDGKRISLQVAKAEVAMP